MRRWATVMTVVTMAAAMAVLGTGGPASASPARAAVRTKAPAKVKPGSTWALHLSGGGCYSETFAAHRFADTDEDSGTYRGATHLRMRVKKGAAAGDVFSGQWSRKSGAYSGMYDHGGVSATAALDPGFCPPVVPVAT
jgi:hypothetical protein